MTAPEHRVIRQCSNCKGFHDDPERGDWYKKHCNDFDPDARCIICDLPVIGLSLIGPSVCPLCDS